MNKDFSDSVADWDTFLDDFVLDVFDVVVGVVRFDGAAVESELLLFLEYWEEFILWWVECE